MITDLIFVPGFHAVKHGLRFGADFVEIVAVEDGGWRMMAAEFAPDIEPDLLARIRIVSNQEFKRFSPGKHPTGIAAIAKRPHYAINPGRNGERVAPAVLLENPHRLGNVGAAVRVAAAAGASSVLTTGAVDPWHAEALQGSAGLHFALPVLKVAGLEDLTGPLIAMDPAGQPIEEAAVPNNAVLAFGTEREGLSEDLMSRADQVVSLPMRDGVSSLNLATSVAATLYALKFIGR